MARQAVIDELSPLVAQWSKGLYHVLTVENDIPFWITDRVRSAQVFVLSIVLAKTGDLGKVLKLSENIGLALDAETPRIARKLGRIDIEMSLPKPFPRTLYARNLARKGKLWIPLGQSTIGTPAHVNLASPNACHVLIAGTTGSGKTVATRLLTWALATDNDPNRVNFLILDGKGARDWDLFKGLAHLVNPVVKGAGYDSMAALGWAVMEMERRTQAPNPQALPRLFVVIDEIRALLETGGKDVAEAITRLASRSRGLGIHLVITTQKPLNDSLGGSIVAGNLPLRLIGRTITAQEAAIATGVKGTGAERLRGEGDFLAVFRGEPTRVQIALTSNRLLGALPRANGQGGGSLPLDDIDLPRVLQANTPAPSPAPGQGPGSKRDMENLAEAVAYVLAHDCGVPALRKHYGPMGTTVGSRVRDFSAAIRAELARLGYTGPLPFKSLPVELAASLGHDEGA